MTPEQPTRVFISYSHDSQAHADEVFALANRLRADGIDCSVDQYEESPPEGWPQWMDRQIRESQFVLVVCSEFYFNKLHGKVKPDEGHGVKWEGKLVYQHLYNEAANSKFIPVLLANGKPEHIPTPLQGATHYRPSQKSDFDRLYWRLRGVPLKQKPALGKLKPLPPRERKTNPGLFITGFIDIPLWDKAQWKGVFYIPDASQPPIMGLLFQNKEAAIQIFTQWYVRIGRADDYEEMRISIVEGDVPGKDPGYTVYINANIDNILDRADDLGLNVPNEQVMALGRMLRMNPAAESRYLEMFKQAVQQSGSFKLCPAIAETEGVRLLPYSLLKKEIHFRHASEITSTDDMDYAVLKQTDSKGMKGKP
jgi:SEFIR domain-containing protein